jgi:hypothetical protein
MSRKRKKESRRSEQPLRSQPVPGRAPICKWRCSPEFVHGLPGRGRAEALREHLAQRVDSYALGKVGPITIDPQFTRYQLQGESRIRRARASPRTNHRGGLATSSPEALAG